MNNKIEGATPIMFSQNSLNLCLAHFGMADFDVDGYITEVNDLVNTPYPKTISFWIEKYKPPPSSSIFSC